MTLKTDKISLSQLGQSRHLGSALLFFPNKKLIGLEPAQFIGEFSADFRTFIVNSSPNSENSVIEFAVELSKLLVKHRIKRGTAFGIGTGASIAQALAITAPRMVRHIVLLDSTTRLEPSFVSRFIDSIEKCLPMGLPLRRISKAFDSRPMLHRINCPALVLYSTNATSYIRSQAQYIACKIPNAWLYGLKTPHTTSEGKASDELKSILNKFLQVPRKRPQKASEGITSPVSESSLFVVEPKQIITNR
jgi:pimeloyl-ACP methyl ester carboxylesterase